MRHQVLGDKLSELTGQDVLQGKGGFWLRAMKGHLARFVTLVEARKMTDTPTPHRRSSGNPLSTFWY